MRRWPVEAVVAWLPVLGLPCCTPLVESMLRTCLWCVLLRGCALGDVAATGTCILWMLALHGSTVASCRAFSMLVMLGLDERSFSLEGKVILCAVVAMAPLFPPREASADYMLEVRDYKAQHGSAPVENRESAGYTLATRIWKARAKGVFESEVAVGQGWATATGQAGREKETNSESRGHQELQKELARVKQTAQEIEKEIAVLVAQEDYSGAAKAYSLLFFLSRI